MKKISDLPGRTSPYFIPLITLGTLFYLACQSNTPDKHLGDTIAITGTVVDSLTGRPISGAWVDTENDNSTRTNKKGTFTLEVSREKKLELYISALQHERKRFYFTFHPLEKNLRIPIIQLAPLRDNFYSRPFPESLITEKEWKEQYFLPLPPGIKPKRTTVPPILPPGGAFRYNPIITIDSSGGKWVIFETSPFSPLFITYVDSYGSIEKSCVTEFREIYIDSLQLESNGISIFGRDISYPKRHQRSYHYSLDDLRLDSDNDGIVNRYEILCGLNPKYTDSDSDGIGDLNDPMPLMPKPAIANDTMAILTTCLENNFIFEPLSKYSGLSLVSFKAIYPRDASDYLFKKAADLGLYDPEGRQSNTWFQNSPKAVGVLLLNMTPNEIHYFISCIKKVKTRYRFPFLNLLSNINDSNWVEIKQNLADSLFIFFVVPQYYVDRAFDYKAHPENTFKMYLPGDKKHAYVEFLYSKFGVEDKYTLEMMSKDAAVVEANFVKYYLVKRNESWILVGRRQIGVQ